MKHRKLKTCLLIACIPVLVLVFYALLDFKPMPFIAQYRLAEKAAMVGPGEILGISTIKPTPASTAYKVVAARTEQGVILYDSELYYRKDLGEPAILVAGSEHYSQFTANSLPLVLFDEFPEAVWAEIELEVTEGFGSSSKLGTTYRMEAARQQEGYFLFVMLSGDYFPFLHHFSSFCAGTSSSTQPIPVQVRLYDKDDCLVADLSTHILSPAIIAHREQSGTDIGG